MTKEHIIQALRYDYLDCIYSSAAQEESSDDEYIEGLLDGRARGILHAIELLKQLDADTQPQPKATINRYNKVPEAITLLQLYLSNANWTANSVLHIVVNGMKMEELMAHVAIIKYGKGRVSSFVENHVYLFTDKEESDE